MNYHPKLVERIVLQTPKSLLGLLVISFIFVYMYFPFIPSVYLGSWFAAYLIFLYLRHLNSKSLSIAAKSGDNIKIISLSRQLMGLITFSALLWGGISVVGFIYAPADYMFFLLVIILGITSAAAFSLSPFFHIFVVFYLIMLGSQMVIFWLIGTEVHLALFFITALFIPLMISLAKSLYQDNLKSIALNDALEVNIEKLHYLSITDPLTKIHNRRYFFNSADQLIALSLREKKDLCLLMLDIDFFKKINDIYGHQVGDEVLIIVSQKIKKMIRKSDIFARVGGEEFAIIFMNMQKEQALSMAKKICKEIEAIHIPHKETSISVTISIGMSSLSAQENTSLLLYNKADKYLYRAKELGRNQVCSSDSN